MSECDVPIHTYAHTHTYSSSVGICDHRSRSKHFQLSAASLARLHLCYAVQELWHLAHKHPQLARERGEKANKIRV